MVVEHQRFRLAVTDVAISHFRENRSRGAVVCVGHDWLQLGKASENGATLHFFTALGQVTETVDRFRSVLIVGYWLEIAGNFRYVCTGDEKKKNQWYHRVPLNIRYSDNI